MERYYQQMSNFCVQSFNCGLLIYSDNNFKFIVKLPIQINERYAKQQNQSIMMNCIEVQYTTLSAQQCKSFDSINAILNQKYSKGFSKVNLYFCGANGMETLIESDSDLIALRYMVRGNNLKFKVELCKSKELIQQVIRQEAVSEYLQDTYDQIADDEVEKELRRISQQYLRELYQEIEDEEEQQRIREIEREEVKKYLGKINSIAIDRHLFSLPMRESKCKKVRFSPQKSQSIQKETIVEKMVSKVLEEMMPMMVKELSARIMGELTMKFNKGGKQLFQYEENPEQI